MSFKQKVFDYHGAWTEVPVFDAQKRRVHVPRDHPRPLSAASTLGDTRLETVLRGRTDHIALVLENCCDDLNHVAVLRTCEVRPSASLTDEQTHAHASHTFY